MVQILNGPDHSNTKQNGGHLVLPFENRTPRIIQIPNAFRIRDPTVQDILVSIIQMVLAMEYLT